MPQTDHASNDSSEAEEHHKKASPSESLPEVSPVRLPVGFRWILIVGGFLLAVLLVVSIFLPNMSERVKFFTVNALSVLVLIAIIVQAYIYRRQADTLEKQSAAMRGQWAAVEWQGGIMEIQAGIFDKQVEKMQGQLDAIENQARIMNDGLTETRKLVGQNERATKAAEDGVKIAQENTVHAQRAYVCVTKVSIQEGNLFSLYIENAGNTPANDTQMVCRAEVLGKDPDPKLAAYSPEHHYSVLGVIAPRAQFQKLKAIDGGFGSEEQRKMQAGWKLYCYGKIYYKDVFGNLRNTYFSFSQRWNTPAAGPSIQGNEAD